MRAAVVSVESELVDELVVELDESEPEEEEGGLLLFVLIEDSFPCLGACESLSCCSLMLLIGVDENYFLNVNLVVMV
jgi:hypothetical protein